AWQEFRNNKKAKVNWQFTAKDARTKPKRLYPTLDPLHDTSRIHSQVGKVNVINLGHFVKCREL
ncbi:MAG: hypothetical protein QF569_23380, partial [Candidatus Poribacteria bacterium]|nr:hypothetical protein [Candidatus Poribacteria bacterium]